MKNFSQIVEFKEEKFGLFKAKNGKGNWYGFLSSISAYFIEDNGREYVTRYLDKNRELIGEVDNVVKLLNIWNIGEHFTARQLCALLFKYTEYSELIEEFADNYDQGQVRQVSSMKYNSSYRTKYVLYCFKDFVTIVDDDKIKEITVDIALGYDMEEKNTNDIKLSIYAYNNAYDFNYRDFETYYESFNDLSKNDDIKQVRRRISERIEISIKDIKNIFGEDVRIVFIKPEKNYFGCRKGNDKNFSRLENLVFNDIRNNYDVIEREKEDEEE